MPNKAFLSGTLMVKRDIVYDIHSQQIYTSRDVIFHETTSPYEDIATPIRKAPISITPIPDDGTLDYHSPANSVPSQSLIDPSIFGSQFEEPLTPSSVHPSLQQAESYRSPSALENIA